MDVSRETKERLDIYLALLKKWNPKINLVSPATLEQAWERHFLDSLQVAGFWENSVKTWADFGSGGGFPGAVVAIALANKEYPPEVTLVESDQRKATFLRTVSRETSVPFQVLTMRIEDVPSLAADVISARALASLSELCSFARPHLKDGGKAYFLKGQKWKEEVSEAQKQWRFTLETHKSVTDPNAVILEIGDLSHA